MSWIKSKRFLLLSSLGITVMVGFGVAAVVYEYGLNRPFPFVHMLYVYQDRDLYDDPSSIEHKTNVSFAIPILSEQRDQVLSRLEMPLDTFANQPFAVAMRIATEMARDITKSGAGDKTRDLASLTVSGPEYAFICSEDAKVFAAIAQVLGFVSRVVWMSSHTATEVYQPGHGWVLVDAHMNLIFRDADDHLLSLKQIFTQGQRQAIPVPISPKLVAHDPNQPTNFYFHGNHAALKYFVVISGPSLFEFEHRSRDPFALLSSVIGVKGIASGIQLVGQETKRVGNLGTRFIQHLSKPEVMAN